MRTKRRNKPFTILGECFDKKVITKRIKSFILLTDSGSILFLLFLQCSGTTLEVILYYTNGDAKHENIEWYYKSWQSFSEESL